MSQIEEPHRLVLEIDELIATARAVVDEWEWWDGAWEPLDAAINRLRQLLERRP
jgi:hypothetical protein